MATTIENLKTAIVGESTACAMYASFASKALQEGYPLIAKLFEATSATERIHAANHTKALVKMGEQPIEYDMSWHVGTTLENLKEALKGETYEYSEMYPPMVAQAEAEGAKDALRSFSWALEAEKVHAAMYAEAIRQLESGEPLNLPAAYVICPLCGDTFPADTAPDKCPLCNMPKAKYIALA